MEEAEPVEDIELPDELAEFGRRFARVMAAGAHESGELEVRRVQLSHVAGKWERYRRTLANQVKVGAYGVVQKEDGSRVAYTTSRGRSQLATLRRWSRGPVRTIRADSLEELKAKLLRDVAKVLVDASRDRRTRAVTARGFTPNP